MPRTLSVAAVVARMASATRLERPHAHHRIDLDAPQRLGRLRGGVEEIETGRVYLHVLHLPLPIARRTGTGLMVVPKTATTATR